MRGGPKTSSNSSSETISGSGLGTTMRALQCGQSPDFPANSLFTCSACPFGQVTLIDIHHLVQENPQGRPRIDLHDYPTKKSYSNRSQKRGACQHILFLQFFWRNIAFGPSRLSCGPLGSALN